MFQNCRKILWFISGNPCRPHCGTGNGQRKSMILSQNSKRHFPSNFMGNIPYSCRGFSSSKGKILQPFKIFKYSSKQTLLKWQTEDQIEGWINIIMPNFDCQYFLHVTWNIYWEINVTYIKPMLSKIIYLTKIITLLVKVYFELRHYRFHTFWERKQL